MEEKKGFIAEFKEFIARGNVLDMAVGVIMATAFGAITSALIDNVIMPVIGLIFGGQDLTDALNIVVHPAELDAAGEVVKEATVIGFGTFLSAILNFIIVALIVFCIVKAFNKARALAEAKKAAEEESEEEEEPAPTAEELLTAILEELKKD